MASTQDVTALWIMKTAFPAGRLTLPHKHPFYHMLYAKDGRIVIQQNGGEWHTIEPGCVAIVPPNTMHSQEGITESLINATELKFIVNNAELERTISQLPPVVRLSEFALELLKRMEAEAKDIGRFFPEIMNTLSALFLYSLAKTAPRPANQKNPALLFDRVAAYIDEHYANDLSIELIAGDLGVKKTYMCSVFKREKGITVYDYIIRVRIKAACKLISFSSRKLAEVSKMCGFKNEYHFNRVFKQTVGIPPAKYRYSHPPGIFEYKNDPAKTIESWVHDSEELFTVAVHAQKPLGKHSEFGTYPEEIRSKLPEGLVNSVRDDALVDPNEKSTSVEK